MLMNPSVNCNYSYHCSVFDWNCDSHRSGGRVKYHLNIRASKLFGFIVQQLVLAIFDLQDGNTVMWWFLPGIKWYVSVYIPSYQVKLKWTWWLGQNFEVWLIHQIFGLMESSIVSFVVDHVYGSHVWENLWDKCRESFVLNYYGKECWWRLDCFRGCRINDWFIAWHQGSCVAEFEARIGCAMHGAKKEEGRIATKYWDCTHIETTEFAMILEESFPLLQRCISASHPEPDTIWNCLKHIGDQAKR